MSLIERFVKIYPGVGGGITVERNLIMGKFKNRKWLIGLLLLLLLIVGGAVVWHNIANKGGVQSELIANAKDARKMSKDQLAKYAQSKADSSQFNLQVYPNAEIHKDISKGYLYVKNSPKNKYAIDIDLVDDKTKKTIYSSGLIQPGYEVTNFGLTKKAKALANGARNGTIRVKIYNRDTHKLEGVTAATVKINVN